MAIEHPNHEDAFREHRRPPRDVVPRAPATDAAAVPTGFVEYHNDELGPDGVTREVGTAFVAPAIMDVDEFMRQRRGDG